MFCLCSFQELKAGQTFIHPEWTGNDDNCFNFAVVKLTKAVNKDSSVLPDPQFPLYPNSQVYGFKTGDVIQVARFNVVETRFCSDGIVPRNGTFCVDTRSTEMLDGKPLTSKK